MNKHWSSYLFDFSNHILLLAFTFACAYPFYYVFIYSISDPVLASRGITFWPAGFTLSTYSQILSLPNIYQAIFISVSRTVVGTLITVFACTMFSYVLTKNDLFARKFMYRFTIITMYISAGLIPWYLTMRALGLKDNFLLYVIPGAISAFFVVLIKTYIEQIPAALEESAMVDGAGYMTILFLIIWPLSMPIIATIAVFTAVGQWNTWTDNFFLVSSSNLQTLQLLLYNYLREAEQFANRTAVQITQMGGTVKMTPMAIKMTITMIATIPIFLVYPFMQRYFVKGIMLGAIKG